MPPDLPNGTQFLATTIANLYGELAAQFDQLKANEARIAELEKENADLKAAKDGSVGA
jgi:cell division protein FtsB